VDLPAIDGLVEMDGKGVGVADDVVGARGVPHVRDQAPLLQGVELVLELQEDVLFVGAA
jgi:hypothetical protein